MTRWCFAYIRVHGLAPGRREKASRHTTRQTVGISTDFGLQDPILNILHHLERLQMPRQAPCVLRWATASSLLRSEPLNCRYRHVSSYQDSPCTPLPCCYPRFEVNIFDRPAPGLSPSPRIPHTSRFKSYLPCSLPNAPATRNLRSGLLEGLSVGVYQYPVTRRRKESVV